MDKELKQTWVDNLLSGKYKQTQGELHNDEGFCCLGVLCDVVAPEDWVKDGTIYTNKVNDQNRVGTLSDHFLVRVGLSSVGAGLLAHLNDLGNSFEFIAKYIEENL